jgi:hypothetical protein
MDVLTGYGELKGVDLLNDIPFRLDLTYAHGGDGRASIGCNRVWLRLGSK